MVLPSCRGGDSTRTVSPSSCARRFRISRPISLWTISRPRKITSVFTLLPSSEEALDVAPLEGEVVLVDLRPELHFLDLDVPLVLARLGLALALLVEELAGVHDPAHRRGGGGRDLHEVEALLLRQHQRLAGGHDPELRPVLVDHPDFLRPDAVVDADRLAVYETPPALGAGASSRVARSADEADDACPERRHVLRSEVARLAVAHGDALRLDFLVPHHEHVGDLLHLGLADPVAQLLVAVVHVHAHAQRAQLLAHFPARRPAASPSPGRPRPARARATAGKPPRSARSARRRTARGCRGARGGP